MTEGILPLPQVDTQPLEYVLRVLELTRTGETTFTGLSLPQVHNRVYGCLLYTSPSPRD